MRPDCGSVYCFSQSARITVKIYGHVLRDHTEAMDNVESLLLPQVAVIGTS
jgi:hypothetical protein